MIDWHPIATPPPMVTKMDRIKPYLYRSAYVLVWLKGGFWQRDRICRMDGEPRPFGELFGFSVTHWTDANSPTEGTT